MMYRNFSDAAAIALGHYLEQMREEVNNLLIDRDDERRVIEDGMNGTWEFGQDGDTLYCTPYYDGNDGLVLQTYEEDGEGESFKTDWGITGNIKRDAASFLQTILACVGDYGTISGLRGEPK